MKTDDYQICTTCVMDTSDPAISFDSRGRCVYCINFQKYIEPGWHADGSAELTLRAELDRIKQIGADREFDCILGLSGGLDSSYLLHLMVTEYAMRPLVFHVDGGWNSELATHNISVLVDSLGIDLYTEVIQWNEMQSFQLACFRAGIPHLDMPQDHAFVATLYRFAEKNNINVILNGGNFATEGVMPPKALYYYGADMRHIRDLTKKFGTVAMQTYPFSSVLRHKLYLRYAKRVRVLKPLNQVKYVQAEAKSTLEKEYGWRAYRQKHFESHFTRFYEGYWLPSRFGYDIRRSQYSSLIISGQMTREDALEKLTLPPLTDLESVQDFSFVASKLGISEDELQHYLNMPKRSYHDYKNSEILFEVGARISRLVRMERSIKQ